MQCSTEKFMPLFNHKEKHIKIIIIYLTKVKKRKEKLNENKGNLMFGKW